MALLKDLTAESKLPVECRNDSVCVCVCVVPHVTAQRPLHTLLFVGAGTRFLRSLPDCHDNEATDRICVGGGRYQMMSG